MSKENPSSWRYLSSAGSKLSSLKGYISGNDLPSTNRSLRFSDVEHSDGEAKQSWRAWAGQKIRDRQNIGVESVQMFPGWAARRYVHLEGRSQSEQGPAPFEVEVFVSGFVSSHRNSVNATRSQRAFMRLAKSFAGLPRYFGPLSSESPAGHPDISVDMLEQELLQANESALDDNDYLTESPPTSPADLPLQTNVERQLLEGDSLCTPEDSLRRRHHNLENRIRHLWYSALPNRTVRLHLLVHPHNHRGHNFPTESLSDPDEILLNTENGHLSTEDVTTEADGSFHTKFKVQWQKLCVHPHIAFEDKMEDHDLLIVAQLLPPNRILQSISVLHPGLPLSTPLISSPTTALHLTAITHSPIRVISDIDDTVKRTEVVSGPRKVFSNVFVNDFNEAVIPEMAKWYMTLFSRGVRFHYVSNGPFSVLSILKEFFQVSQLPPGSLKLRSYSGRSLFEGLIATPASRKRAGVLEVLDSFPNSGFILIGDTGEQDLELYAEIATDRPHQILGAFLRDADADNQDIDPIADPTGLKVLNSSPISSNESPSQSPTYIGSFSSLLSRFPSYSYEDSKRSSSLPTSDTRPPDTNAVTPSRSITDVIPSSFDRIGGSMRDKVIGMGNREYFRLASFTSRTEQEVPGSGTDPSNAQIVQEQIRDCSRPTFANSVNLSPSRSNQSFVSEPPKPTSPPSITNPRTRSIASLNLESQELDFDTFSPYDISLCGSDNGKQPPSSTKRRRTELQMRVYMARQQIPSHIPLRVFRDPAECVEADEIMHLSRV